MSENTPDGFQILAAKLREIDARLDAAPVEPDAPAVPARVRTVAYFLLLAAASIVLLAQGLAPIWLVQDTAEKVVQSAGVFSAVFGLIGGGLGVAYRPTR